MAIVGGGYSGVELACSLAESIGEWADVKLFHRGAQVSNLKPYTLHPTPYTLNPNP